MEKEKKLNNLRHTLAHLLASAVGKIYKFDKIKLTLGPAVENGFYYDIDFGEEKISDTEAKLMARDIALKIEQELKYPGEIKVTMIRETRIVEYAR